MKIKSEITSKMYSFTREFLIGFSVLYGILKYLGWEIPIILLFLTSLFMAAVTRFINAYKLKKEILIIPFIFLIVTLVLKFSFHINTLLFFKEAFLWNYEYYKGTGEFQLSYSLVAACILFFVVMEIIFKAEKNIISEFIMALVLFTFTIICGMNNIQWNPVIIGIVLFCCFDIMIEVYQIKAGRAERYATRCLAPFIAGAVLIAICIPSNKEPIKWELVKSVINNIGENVQEIIYNLEWEGNGEKNEFNVSKAGYSDERNSFFGKLIDEKERTMFLLSTRNDLRVRYLNGNMYNTYTGSEWKKEENSYNEDYTTELYEKLYNLYYLDIKQPTDEFFARKVRYQIKFDRIETKTIFRPENFYNIDDNTNDIDAEIVGDNVYLNQKEKRGYSYFVSSLSMNTDYKELKQYLESLNENGYYNEAKNAEGNFKDSLFQVSVNQIGLSDDKIAYIISDDFRKQLSERSKRIKEQYLQVPTETPERVRKLAEEITKDYTNQYDKAEAICKYLKENYEYTTSIDELPAGKDAADYFLFEQKKGYCTYFASTMAVMCRSVNIPVRYVEGVVLNYGDKDDDFFKIKTKDAHAWTEIYLEGFGWIRMDATPGYYDNTSWAMNDGMWYGYGYGNKQGVKSEGKSQSMAEESQVQVDENHSYDVVLLLKYSIVGVICSLIVFLLVIVALIWNKKRIYKKSSNREKIFICIKKIMSNLEKQGYELKAGETLKEYKERLENDVAFDNVDILKLLEWFQDVRYSKKIVTEEEVLLAEHFLLTNNR